MNTSEAAILVTCAVSILAICVALFIPIREPKKRSKYNWGRPVDDEDGPMGGVNKQETTGREHTSDNNSSYKGDSGDYDSGGNYESIEVEMEVLLDWIGVSEPVDAERLYGMVRSGAEQAVVNEIAKALSLPNKITVRHATQPKLNLDGTSTLAEVAIESNLPRYWDKDFANHLCVVTLYPGADSTPERFVYVIAHELSHYVMQSLRPPRTNPNDEERATDLAVVFGGFLAPYMAGRKDHKDRVAGYFRDDNEFRHVCARYKEELAKRRGEYEAVRRKYRSMKEAQADTILFLERCGLLLDHPETKLEVGDVSAIGVCLSMVGKGEVVSLRKRIRRLNSMLSTRRYVDASRYEEEIKKLELALKNIGLPAMGEIAILMKYTDQYA